MKEMNVHIDDIETYHDDYVYDEEILSTTGQHYRHIRLILEDRLDLKRMIKEIEDEFDWTNHDLELLLSNN